MALISRIFRVRRSIWVGIILFIFVAFTLLTKTNDQCNLEEVVQTVEEVVSTVTVEQHFYNLLFFFCKLAYFICSARSISKGT